MISCKQNTMRKNIVLLIGFLSSFLSTSILGAQSTTLLPNEGKMLTTVMVVCAILSGIFLFLFFLERRITKLENQIKDEQ